MLDIEPTCPSPHHSSTALPATPQTPSTDYMKESLESSSFEGDFTRARSILLDWTSNVSLSSPKPVDLSTALDYAVIHGHVSIVRLLLDHGAPITVSTTAMATRSDKPNSLAIFQEFLEHGWSVQSTANQRGPMAMCLIMSNPDGESLLKWFLDHGAPASGLPSDPGAPLRYAPTAATASLLLDHGAVLKYTSALHATVAQNNDAHALPLMKLLLDNGVDVNELEYEGRDNLPRGACLHDHGTALHVAAEKGFVERAKILIERGASLEAKSKNGYAPRDYAQLYGKEEMRLYLESLMRQKGIEVKQLVDIEEDEDEILRREFDREGSITY